MIVVNWATEPDFIIGLMSAISDQRRFVYIYGSSTRQLDIWISDITEYIPPQWVVGMLQTRGLLGVKDTYLFTLPNIDVRPLVIETTRRNIEIVEVRNVWE